MSNGPGAVRQLRERPVAAQEHFTNCSNAQERTRSLPPGTAGKNCKLHHNDPCKFAKDSKCNLGDFKTGGKCPFPHWNAGGGAGVEQL